MTSESFNDKIKKQVNVKVKRCNGHCEVREVHLAAEVQRAGQQYCVTSTLHHPSSRDGDNHNQEGERAETEHNHRLHPTMSRHPTMLYSSLETPTCTLPRS